jgi:hypothetical protein
MKKRALLVVHINTFFIELFNAGLILKDSLDYQPVFYFSMDYPTVQKDIARCQNVGLEVIDFQRGAVAPVSGMSESASAAAVSGWKSVLKKRLPEKLVELISSLNSRRHRFVYQRRRSSLVCQYRLLKKRQQELKDFLLRQKPDILLLGGHMVGYDSAVYIQAAQRLKIPVVIVSSTMDNGQSQAESYFPDPKHSLRPPMNRFAGWLYPHWVRDWRGKKLIRMPWGRVLAMEWLGLAPPLPWVAGSGDADAIAVESGEMVRFYTEAGLPREQLVVTGSLTDDILTAATQEAPARKVALCHELALPDNRPMLLSALPPDTLYMAGGRPQCDFQTYPDLVEFWIKSLAMVQNWNIVVLLHPSVSYDEMRYIEDWGVKIARHPSAEIVPLCDLYVTSVSSTIRWAIACSKPVVNYDVYRYYYEGFMHVKGVLYTEEQAGFQELLQRLTTDNDFLQQTAEAQAKAAPDWGFLDGRTGQRMLELLDSLIEKYN